MERPQPQEGSWDIAVACDIRIGELFRNNPALKDKYLDIDVDAIDYILEGFDQDSSGGSLVFMATHDTLLNPNYERKHHVFGQTKRTRHGLMAKPKPNSPVEVKVGVGGSFTAIHDTFYDTYKDVYKRSLSELPPFDTKEKVPRAGRLNKLLGRTMIKGGIDTVAESHGVIHSESSLQGTVVHELRHAADSKEQLALDRKVSRRAYFRMFGGPAIGTLIATNVAMDKIDNVFASTAVGAGVLALAALPLRHGATRYRNFMRKERPTEIRAYGVESFAEQLPKVISFKSNTRMQFRELGQAAKQLADEVL